MSIDESKAIAALADLKSITDAAKADAKKLQLVKDGTLVQVVVTSHRNDGYWCAKKKWVHGISGESGEVLVTPGQLHELKADPTGFITCRTMAEHLAALEATRSKAGVSEDNQELLSLRARNKDLEARNKDLEAQLQALKRGK